MRRRARSPTSPQDSFTSASGLFNDAGTNLGVAVGSADAGAGPQLFASDPTSGLFVPLANFSLLPQDPFATDLDAVALDPSGQGWSAGNPAGLTEDANTAAGLDPIGFPSQLHFPGQPNQSSQAVSGEPAPLRPFEANTLASPFPASGKLNTQLPRPAGRTLPLHPDDQRAAEQRGGFLRLVVDLRRSDDGRRDRRWLHGAADGWRERRRARHQPGRRRRAGDRAGRV